MANFYTFREGKQEEVKVSSAFVKAVTGCKVYTCVTNFPMHMCRSIHGISFVTIGSYWGLDSQTKSGQTLARMYEYDASGKRHEDSYLEIETEHIPCYFEEGMYTYQEAFLIANTPRVISKLDSGFDSPQYYMYYPDQNNIGMAFGYYSESQLYSNCRYHYLFFRGHYYQLNFRERILEQVPCEEVLDNVGIFNWKEYSFLRRCHDFMRDRNTQLLLMPSLGNLPGAPYFLSPDLIEDGVDFSGSRIGKLVQYGTLRGIEIPLNRFSGGEGSKTERSTAFQAQIRVLHPKEFGPQFYEMEKENDNIRPFLDSISYENHLENYKKYGFHKPYDSFMILDNIYVTGEWRRHGLGTTVLSILKELMASVFREDIPVLLASPKLIQDQFMKTADPLPYDQRLDFLINAGGELLTDSCNQTPVFLF